MKPSHDSQRQSWFRSFVRWWASPYSHRYHFSRSDPRIMLLLAVAADAGMIFGGTAGLWIARSCCGIFLRCSFPRFGEKA
jgi:hypothetical protein